MPISRGIFVGLILVALLGAALGRPFIYATFTGHKGNLIYVVPSQVAAVIAIEGVGSEPTEIILSNGASLFVRESPQAVMAALIKASSQ